MRPQRLIQFPLILPPEYNSRHSPSHKPKHVKHSKLPMFARIENILSANKTEKGHKEIQIAI